MRRFPIVAALTVALVAGGALFVLGVIGLDHKRDVWVALNACTNATASVASLSVLLAMLLAASILGIAVWRGWQQATLSWRSIRVARRHAVQLSPALDAEARRLGVKGLIVADLPAELAYCAGLWRPSVVVTARLIARLDADALLAVLAHEGAHARRRDPLRQVCADMAARALWIVPAAARLAAHRRLRLEIAADRAALEGAGRRPLVRALLVLHGALPDPGVASGGALLDARIDALAGKRPPGLGLSRRDAVLSLAGLLGCGALLAQAMLGPSAGSDPFVRMPMDSAAVGEMAVSWLLRGGVLMAVWLGLRLHLRDRACRRAVLGR